MAQNSRQYAPVSDSQPHNVWRDVPTLAMGGRSRLEEDDEEDGDVAENLHLATVEEKKRIWWRNAFINALLILSWFVFAILLTMYNKWIVSDDHYNFGFPLFISSLHMWVQWALAATLRYTMPYRFKPLHSPTPKDYAQRVVPTAFTTAIDIGFSNWALKIITVSLYTMAKSSTLIFTLFFAFLFKLETVSLRLVLVVLLIAAGVFLTVAAETEIVLLGLILILTASASAGLRWALTQLLLKTPRLGMNNPAATIFFLAPSMGVALSILSMTIEGWGNIFSHPALSTSKAALTIPLLIFPGALAFGMIMSEYSIVQRAGMVPLSIAGIFKEVATLSVSAWLFGDRLNPVNIVGVIITFIGITLFTYHKYRKSITSTVQLDAHGNPIEIVGEDGRVVELRLPSNSNLEEREVLRHSKETDRLSADRLRDLTSLPRNTPTQHVLFSAGDVSEFAESDSRPVSPPRTKGEDHHVTRPLVGFNLNDPVVRQSLEISREWGSPRNS